MFINDVVSGVRRVLPGEYTAEEIYKWCDELSADLRLNYCKKYARQEIEAVNGCFYLPEGITTEMVCSVIDKNKEIPKCDFRTSGYFHIYTEDGNMIVKASGELPSSVIVNYIIPHMPIRVVNELSEITDVSDNFDDGLKYIAFSKPIDLAVGDIIKITSDGMETNVSVLKITFDDSGNLIIGYNGDRLTVPEARVTRHITDETVCGAPYDNMYIDFCTMKIAWYQRNYPVYGYMSGSFHDKLSSFSKYLRRNAGTEEITRIINY